ncbi:MAG: GNAT family N-acetyltransferase [Polyangiaceae bacterium]
MDAPDLHIRRLSEVDVPACAALARTVGWRSLESQWTMMLGVGDGFGAETDGTLVGTVIMNRFGNTLASVAMMVVSPAHQRRGVGHRLMVAGLEHAGGAAVFLYATEVGRVLYERLGFVQVGASRRMTGPAIDRSGLVIEGARPMRSADLPRVHALDEEAQGAPRHRLFDALIPNVDRASVVERAGEIVAFGLSTTNDKRRVLGPIVAGDDDSARDVAAHLCVASDLPVVLDLDAGDEALYRWATNAGLTVEGTTMMMALRGTPLPGRRELVRALAGRAFG